MELRLYDKDTQVGKGFNIPDTATQHIFAATEKQDLNEAVNEFLFNVLIAGRIYVNDEQRRQLIQQKESDLSTALQELDERIKRDWEPPVKDASAEVVVVEDVIEVIP